MKEVGSGESEAIAKILEMEAIVQVVVGGDKAARRQEIERAEINGIVEIAMTLVERTQIVEVMVIHRTKQEDRDVSVHQERVFFLFTLNI